jgi:hypothetical protein
VREKKKEKDREGKSEWGTMSEVLDIERQAAAAKEERYATLSIQLMKSVLYNWVSAKWRKMEEKSHFIRQEQWLHI